MTCIEDGIDTALVLFGYALCIIAAGVVYGLATTAGQALWEKLTSSDDGGIEELSEATRSAFAEVDKQIAALRKLVEAMEEE